MTSDRQPDVYERQREAKIIEAKRSERAVMYGQHSRLFWVFGSPSPDGVPIAARSASELWGSCGRLSATN